MKILILGHGRHGKDTVAEILRDEYGVSFMSSSAACLDVIYPVLNLVNGEWSLPVHYAERHKHRELWKRLISLYNAADPSALTKLILGKCDLYVGMRSAREFRASWLLFDQIIWVDASERVPEMDPTMEITFAPHCMFCIDNNGDMESLRASVRQVAKDIGL